MKVLFFTLLCSVSLTQGMGKATLTPQEQVEKELFSLNRCLRYTKLTIEEIKAGASDLPTLKDAQAAQDRLEDQSKRLNKISTWIDVVHPSNKRILTVFAAYKAENKKQFQQQAQCFTPDPTQNKRSPKKRNGLTFEEFFEKDNQEELKRSVSAPTTTQEQINAHTFVEKIIDEEETEPSINETFGTLFIEKA